MFKEEIDLNTHFDLSRGKSKLSRKESNIFIDPPEKHELEESEKTKLMKHPVLSIEEDDDEGKDDNDNDIVVDNDDVAVEQRDRSKKKISVRIQKGAAKKLVALFEAKNN